MPDACQVSQWSFSPVKIWKRSREERERVTTTPPRRPVSRWELRISAEKMSTYAGSEPTVVRVAVLGSTDWAVQLSLESHWYFLHSQWCSGVSVTESLHYLLSSPQTKDRLVGLVVKASVSGAEDPGFESRLRRDFFPGRVIPVTSKLTHQWLPCQVPGVIGSALWLVGPVSAYCDWVR